jgi:hypothetical protein
VRGNSLPRDDEPRVVVEPAAEIAGTVEDAAGVADARVLLLAKSAHGSAVAACVGDLGGRCCSCGLVAER